MWCDTPPFDDTPLCDTPDGLFLEWNKVWVMSDDILPSCPVST